MQEMGALYLSDNIYNAFIYASIIQELVVGPITNQRGLGPPVR